MIALTAGISTWVRSAIARARSIEWTVGFFTLLSICIFASTADAASLVRGFAGTPPNDFGTVALANNDDGSTSAISLTTVFPNGITYFGKNYTNFYINNNGNITFAGPVGSYTPVAFPSSSQPMIAPFWADVDTRAGAVGSLANEVFYTFSGTSVYITWDYVGYFGNHNDKLNAFQLILTNRSDRAEGDFDVQFVYEQIQWTTGDSSGGSGGLGGTPAQVGFDAGDGVNYVKQKDSFTANVVNMASTTNVGTPGIWKWEVRNGVVAEPPFLLNITAPPAGAAVELASGTTYSVSTSADTSIAKVDFYVDQTLIQTLTSSPYQITWPLNAASLGQHTLRVVATNEAGQSEAVSETVTVVDTTGPSVSNIAYGGTPLSDGATIATEAILSATVSDLGGVASVALAIDGNAINGGTYSLTNNQFSIPLAYDAIANGAHQFTLTAKDAQGNSTTFNIGFTLAIPPPPAPNILSPASGTITSQAAVPVSGNSAARTQVQLYLDDSAAGPLLSLDSSNNFTGSVTLAGEGSHQLSAQAVTIHGSSARTPAVEISYDISGPAIQNVQYGGAAFSNGATLTTVAPLTAQISDASGVSAVTVVIDGNPVTGGVLSGTQYFIQLHLDQVANGTHSLSISAVDVVGNPSSQTISFSLSIPPPPAPTITAPQNGDKFKTSNVAVSGSSASGSQVQLYLDDVAVGSLITAAADGSFSGPVTLNGQGVHQISADARTGRGTSPRSTEIQITYDSIGPVIQNVTYGATPLVEGATINSLQSLAGQVSDSSGVASVAVSVDGAPVAGVVLSSSQFTANHVFDLVPNGTHALAIVATDSLGNSTQLGYNVAISLPAPSTPVITSPVSGATVTQPSVSISGTADYGSQVQLYLDGAAVGGQLAVGSSGTFSGNVTLPSQGPHSLTAQAQSARGSSGMSSPVALTYTAPPPTIVITSPSNNATLTSDTDISVAIVDTASINQVEFDIDGSAAATLTSAPYTWHWALSTTTAGNHAIAVKATDAAGNLLQASVAVTVQITPPPPPPVVTPYTGTVQSIVPPASYGQTPITISGQAIDRVTANPVPNALLTLVLQVNGFQRTISVTTDGTGSYSYAFNPYPNDAGTYAVSVIHPLETTFTRQGQFTINRLSVSPGIYNLQAARTVAATIPVTVSASTGTGVAGVYLSADPESQPSGSLPPGITITPPSAIDLAAGASSTINVQFLANNSGADTGTIVLVAHASDSGSASRGTITVNYALSAPAPALYPQPSFIQTGVSQGNQVLATVQIQNKGLIAATNVVAQLQNSNGSTNVPSWVSLASSTVAATLAVGAAQTIQLNAAPTASVASGIYTFQIQVGADNAAGGTIPVSIAVTQSGVGNAAFNAADIYTNTLNSSGQTIPGLAGATIRVQNQSVYTVVGTATTDANGNAEIDNLPVGFYNFVASAPNHSDASGVLTILPGSTTTQSVFLDYNLISIQWSVTETTISDEYQVSLNATYQTQVPAPVVLIEPTVVNLPDLQVGETFAGEMTITNYGLVRADNVVFTPPASDSYYQYQFMGKVPSSLEAHQRISLPYKVTNIAALPASSLASAVAKAHINLGAISSSLGALGTVAKALANGGLASSQAASGSCYSYNVSLALQDTFQCANGSTSSGSSSASFARIYGVCSSAVPVVPVVSSPAPPGAWTPPTGAGPGSWTGTPLGTTPGCTPECQTCKCKGGEDSADD